MTEKHNLRLEDCLPFLRLEEWVAQWAILMTREWAPDRYPETME